MLCYASLLYAIIHYAMLWYAMQSYIVKRKDLADRCSQVRHINIHHISQISLNLLTSMLLNMHTSENTQSGAWCRCYVCGMVSELTWCALWSDLTVWPTDLDRNYTDLKGLLNTEQQHNVIAVRCCVIRGSRLYYTVRMTLYCSALSWSPRLEESRQESRFLYSLTTIYAPP